VKKRDFFIVLLILLNITLIIKVIVLSRAVNASNSLSLPGMVFIPHFSLVDLSGEIWSAERILSEAPYSMLVFFSLQDCPICLSESSLWESVFESRQVGVIGIAKHVNERELIIWTENAGIKFPVLFDRQGDVTNLFHIDKTPLKILIDHSGRIVMIDPLRLGETECERFRQLLRKHVLPGASEGHVSGMS
jgi:peroxiredoxin